MAVVASSVASAFIADQPPGLVTALRAVRVLRIFGKVGLGSARASRASLGPRCLLGLRALSALAPLHPQVLRFSHPPSPPSLLPPTAGVPLTAFGPSESSPIPGTMIPPCPSPSSPGLLGGQSPSPCSCEQATVWICYKSDCSRGADRAPGVQVRALRNVVASLSLALSPVLSVFCILLLVLSIGAASRSPTRTRNTMCCQHRAMCCQNRIETACFAPKMPANIPALFDFRTACSPLPHRAPLQADF